MTEFNAHAFDDEHFAFEHLRSVQPLAQTQPLGNLMLTLTSLEHYATGFVASLLLEYSNPTADPAYAQRLQSGLLAISAHDAHGNAYTGRPRAGYGGGPPTDWQMRQVYVFTPALTDHAQTLTLEVHVVTSLGWDTTTGTLQWTQQDVLAGPWQATFALSAGDVVNAHDAATPHPNQPQIPDLNAAHLLRAIPVAQHQTHAGIAIILYALECYRSGMLAVLRVDWTDGSGMLPRLNWLLHDDLGNRYTHLDCGGSGGGRPPHQWIWRIDCRFTPALNPQATTLTLELPAFTVGPDRFVQRTNTTNSHQTIHGPWRFVVPLDA